VLPNLKRIISGIACLVLVFCAAAQTDTHVVTGRFTEKVIAELYLNKVVDNKFQKIVEYKISPENGNFLFAIPKDRTAAYRLQINLYIPNGRHPKLAKICVLPLTLNPDLNYTLKITPSKLDSAKKAGWELKEDEAKSSVALISGNLVNLNTKFTLPISLENVADGTLVSGKSFQTDSEGEFEIPCQVKQEGFYYLSSPRWRVRVYLKPADRIELNIDNNTGALVNVTGSSENQLLYQWQQLIAPITSYGYNVSIFNVDSVDLNSYIGVCEKLQPVIDSFSRRFSSKNPRFSDAFKNAMNLDRELAPLNLLYNLSVKKVKGFRPRPKNFNEVPSFYQQFICPGKFSNASILLLGEARQYMELYAKLNLALLPKEKRDDLSQGDKLKLMLNCIANDTLKSFFFNDQMWQMEVNNLSEFRETFEPFKKYAKWAPAKDAYQSIYSLFSGDTAIIGKSSYNFTLPDTSGRMVSMKDFKGKVIFIDVWATWCGPCKAQIPFLKEVEEEYKDNKGIVFMGISLDRAKDREKWIDFIKKENLQGVQLIDEGWKDFAKKYQINAIPRFLLIDKQGKWIEIRCPRPESKENLKKYLDKALQQ
jgi:thiol-disulfide isomerase/thioredoxin